MTRTESAVPKSLTEAQVREIAREEIGAFVTGTPPAPIIDTRTRADKFADNAADPVRCVSGNRAMMMSAARRTAVRVVAGALRRLPGDLLSALQLAGDAEGANPLVWVAVNQALKATSGYDLEAVAAWALDDQRSALAAAGEYLADAVAAHTRGGAL